MGIFKRCFSFFGYEIRIQALPFKYKQEVQDLFNLLEAENYAACERDLQVAFSHWGDTPELLKFQDSLDDALDFDYKQFYKKF